jgi:ubiquinone/menaquinone biosynthesis C-methylase UbiE
MISTHEAEVASRFDLLHGRFKTALGPDDYRLRGIVEALGSVKHLRILDLGCGKGRFARALQELGASVVGMDLSSAMLSAASGLDRVRATARRLPFRDGAFYAAIAVEVLEHIDPRCRLDAFDESRRVLRPGGRLVIVDKNVASLNASRPWLPGVAAKRIDEYRGRWMYPAGGPVRECWFWPGGLRAELGRSFQDVRVVHLLSPAEEAGFVFRRVPAVRLMTLWVASVPGGRHV